MYHTSLTIDGIKKHKDNLEIQINDLNVLEEKISEIINSKASSCDELIAQKYIEFQKLNDVVDWLHDNGYKFQSFSKVKGERKYITNDIADVMEKYRKDSIIFSLAYALFQYNKQKIDIRSVVKVIKA